MIGAPIGAAAIGGAFPGIRTVIQALQATRTLAAALVTALAFSVLLQATRTLSATLRRQTGKGLIATRTLAASVRKGFSVQLIATRTLSALFGWFEIVPGQAPWGEQSEQGGVWTRQDRQGSSWE